MSATLILITYLSGQTLYVVLVDPTTGQFWNTSTLAFESYNSAHWANYVVLLTETGATGLYTGTYPSQITTVLATAVFYSERNPGTPAPSDGPPIQVGSPQGVNIAQINNDTLAAENLQSAADGSSSVIIIGSSSIVAKLRTLVRDLATSNKSVSETPKGVNDGSNTKFRLQNPILITSSIWWSSGATYRSQTGITIDDADMGLITISPAPAIGTADAPLIVDYYFNWFKDTDYNEFLGEAARDLLGLSDYSTVIDGLISALLMYARGHFYMARATQYAHRYSSSGGQAGQSVDVVTQNFRNLAKDSYAKAIDLRDQYYERLGQRNVPASQAVAFRISPITPPR